MKQRQLRARYWRIVFFFGRLTLGVVLWDILLPKLGLGRLSSRTRARRNRNAAIRFRALAIRMTGLMIKVGQFLSARLDVLPKEITDELADLQDEVPAEAFGAIKQQAERELGASLDSKYASFDETPMAAASLGQVHRATLHPAQAEQAGFTNVVVKVQRPCIGQIVDVDLAALRRVGTWLQQYKPVARRADVLALVEEFAATTREEIDYLAEGANAETFARNFDHAPHVHVPEVVWDLSTTRVLTLEDVAAIKIGDYAAITAAGIDRGPWRRRCSTPTCSRSSTTASSTPTRTRATSSSRPCPAPTPRAPPTGSSPSSTSAWWAECPRTSAAACAKCSSAS